MTRKQLLAAGIIMMTATLGYAAKNNDGEITRNTIGITNNPCYIRIDLQVRYDDPKNIKNGIGRSSVRIPAIYIDGHTLYLDGNTFEEIQLVGMDENGNESIVYSSVIPAGAETVDIPTGFTGAYEIRFVRAGYCFYGEVMI